MTPMNLEDALEKYEGRRISSLSPAECRELIGAYGDLTSELKAGHDADDAQAWRAVLMDNMDASSPDEII